MRRDFLGLLKSQMETPWLMARDSPCRPGRQKRQLSPCNCHRFLLGSTPTYLAKSQPSSQQPSSLEQAASAWQTTDHDLSCSRGLLPQGVRHAETASSPGGAETTTGLLTRTLQKQGMLSREVEGPSTPVVSLTVLISEQLCHFAFVVTLPLLPCL